MKISQYLIFPLPVRNCCVHLGSQLVRSPRSPLRFWMLQSCRMTFTSIWWTGPPSTCSVLDWVPVFTSGVPVPARYCWVCVCGYSDKHVNSGTWYSLAWYVYLLKSFSTLLCLRESFARLCFFPGNKTVWFISGGRLSHICWLVRKGEYCFCAVLNFLTTSFMKLGCLSLAWVRGFCILSGQPGCSGNAQRLRTDLGRWCWEETLCSGGAHSQSWWESLQC